jgi:AraC-like DNA-binding protein
VLQQFQVQVRFHPPPEALRRYFTTFYHVEWSVPGGERLEDHLMPEWANLRIHDGDWPEAWSLDGQHVAGTHFPVTGPSSQAVRFAGGSTRMWGIGLLPLGWAKFVGVPAAAYADCVRDGMSDPAFAQFRPLAEGLYGPAPDHQAEYGRIAAFFMERLGEPVADEARITAIHAALVDPEIGSVGQLVARVGVSQRTVERVCARAFGFSPKLLLRRQRFMRSLSQFMLDPSLKWIGAIDDNYHDQAQFVRNCRQFMGMTPTQYAALPKPLIGAVMRERERMAGSAVQTLDGPEGPVRRR